MSPNVQEAQSQLDTSLTDDRNISEERTEGAGQLGNVWKGVRPRGWQFAVSKVQVKEKESLA